jgi:hypothetical protein
MLARNWEMVSISHVESRITILISRIPWPAFGTLLARAILTLDGAHGISGWVSRQSYDTQNLYGINALHPEMALHH